MKRGQIWVETVIYTLIAFVMIGLVLGYARPKIQELQDKAIIEQSISTLKSIDIIILNMGGPGNQRVAELSIKEGSLEIDGINDKLIFKTEGKYTYSEPGQTVKDANIFIITEKIGDYNLVSLTRNYENEYNITYDNEDRLKTISKSTVSYSLSISNKGKGKFNTTEACTAPIDPITECVNYEGYIEDCIGGYCDYTEDRTMLNFEIK